MPASRPSRQPCPCQSTVQVCGRVYVCLSAQGRGRTHHITLSPLTPLSRSFCVSVACKKVGWPPSHRARRGRRRHSPRPCERGNTPSPCQSGAACGSSLPAGPSQPPYRPPWARPTRGKTQGQNKETAQSQTAGHVDAAVWMVSRNRARDLTGLRGAVVVVCLHAQCMHPPPTYTNTHIAKQTHAQSMHRPPTYT
jgi:hypothetical protein